MFFHNFYYSWWRITRKLNKVCLIFTCAFFNQFFTHIFLPSLVTGLLLVHIYIYIYIYIYTFTKDCFWRQSYVFSPWIWGPQKNVGTSKCSQIQCGLFFYMVDLTRSWNAFLNHVPKNFFLSLVMSLRPC